MTIDPKTWFPVPDSELMDQDGEPTGVFNIDCRFTDHPVLNVAKSKIARHNVYDLAPCLNMRIHYNSDLDPVKVKNGVSHVMRFDKGEDTRVKTMVSGPAGNMVEHYEGSAGMGKEEFDAAIRDIVRCWDAWQHYQKFREAPVHPMETKALEIIDHMPSVSRPGVVMVDVGGKVEPRQFEQDPGEDEDDDEDSKPQRKAAPKKRTQRGKAAA